MVSPVDVDELFSKCMTESDIEKLTARTVIQYITSPFAIHCDKFAPEAERDEITAFEDLLFHGERILRSNMCVTNFLIQSQYQR